MTDQTTPETPVTESASTPAPPAPPKPDLVTPFVPPPDGYNITVNLMLDGYRTLQISYRPLTRKLWRQHFAASGKLATQEEKDRARDEFVVSRVHEWGVLDDEGKLRPFIGPDGNPVPLPTVDLLDDMHPDGMAEIIFGLIQYGVQSQIKPVLVTGPKDVDKTLGN